MSATEMKDFIKAKLDAMPDELVEKNFPKIVETLEITEAEKVDLKKYVPGIFDKYDELMKKLA